MDWLPSGAPAVSWCRLLKPAVPTPGADGGLIPAGTGARPVPGAVQGAGHPRPFPRPEAASLWRVQTARPPRSAGGQSFQFTRKSRAAGQARRRGKSRAAGGPGRGVGGGGVGGQGGVLLVAAWRPEWGAGRRPGAPRCRLRGSPSLRTGRRRRACRRDPTQTVRVMAQARGRGGESEAHAVSGTPPSAAPRPPPCRAERTRTEDRTRERSRAATCRALRSLRVTNRCALDGAASRGLAPSRYVHTALAAAPHATRPVLGPRALRPAGASPAAAPAVAPVRGGRWPAGPGAAQPVFPLSPAPRACPLP